MVEGEAGLEIDKREKEKEKRRKAKGKVTYIWRIWIVDDLIYNFMP